MRRIVKTVEAILAVATALTAGGVLAETWTNPRSYLGETWSYSADESGVCVFGVYGGRYESGDGTLRFDMSLYDFPGTINSVEGFWNERWDSVDFRYLTTLRSFGFKAFYACPNLRTVEGVPAGVTNIGAYAFANCGNLSMCNVVQEGRKGITKGLKSIGTGAFSNCGFAWVTIPSTVDRIGELAFSECRRLRYAYVSTACEIAANAFSGCPKDFQLLKYKPNQVVKFVDRGQTISTRTINYGECYGYLPQPIRDDWVFVGWELDGNLIGDQSICYQVDDHIFTAVWKQTAIMAFDANGGIGSVTNEQDCATTLSIPEVSREGYTLLGWSPTPPDLVPESNMTFIAQWRINNYKVIFDSNGGSGGVTNIQTYASDIIAPHVERWGCIFDGWIPDVCPTVPASNVTYTARWKVCEVVLDSVEQGMSTLYPKDYQTVQTVYLPAGIARIPSFFFAGCSSLTKVSIPDSVTEIDYYAFDGCDALIDTVTIPGVKIVDGWVVGYTAALNENLKLNGVRGIASYAFNRCTGLKDITIGDGVKGIGWLAFDDCFGLTNVTISAGVTNIADGAFSGCTNVTSLTASAIPGSMPREQLVTVRISDGVTHIGTFAGCTGLKNVAIPDSVTDIGGAAFRDCSALKEIVMPKGLKRIGDYAFERCVSIKSIEVPDGVETIGECVFAGCTNLQTVTIPSSVKSKPYGWFNGCDSLRSVVIPGHIGMTGYGKFVEEITISRGSTNICDCAFEGCINITNISIPDEVVSIGGRAFGDCDKLESIYMPNGVKSIGDSAFSGCTSLSNATIPGSVTNIGVSLFWGCPGIIDAKVPQCVLDRGLQNVFPDSYATITNVSYSSVISRIPERAFYGCAKLKSVVVPEGVQCIGKYAFEECEDLEEVLLPESVVIIEECAFRGCKNLKNMPIPNNVGSIGWGAFDGCCSLTTLTIPQGVAQIGDYAFQNCLGLTNVTIENNIMDIGYGAFFGCSNVVSLTAIEIPSGLPRNQLITVQIPNGTTNIVSGAFSDCPNLRSVFIPDSVESVGNQAFCNCSNLTDITIPDNVKTIGSEAFANCRRIGEVKIPDGVDAIEAMTFIDCTGLTNVVIGSGVRSISFQAFEDCSSLTSIVVPKSVESIDGRVFSGCISMTNMVLPFVGSCRGSKSLFGYEGEDLFGWIFGWWEYYDGEKAVDQYYGAGKCRTYWIPASLRCVEITDENQIGVGAFSNCRMLTSVIIPDSVMRIGDNAFEYCDGLTSIIIPDGVTDIGFEAFRACSGLTKIVIPVSVRHMEVAFPGCNNLKKIVVPGHLRLNCDFEDNVADVEISEGSTFVNEYLFAGCSLRSVIIPDSVGIIGLGAFYNCTNLMSVTIGSGVTNIEEHAFWNCIGLKSLTIPANVTKIDWGAFHGCDGLTDITIGSSVASIKGSAFDGCTNVIEITVPGWNCGIPMGSVTNLMITPGTLKIADGAFCDCSAIRRVSIPDGVTNIGDSAFAGCSAIERLTIPESVCSEGLQKVFPDACSHINEIEILDGTGSIGQNGFAGCRGLTSITMPPSIASVGDYAFSGCAGIERVNIDDFSAWLQIRFGIESNPLSVSPQAVLYLNGEPLTVEGTFVVPDDVEAIPDGAFRNQTRLTNIVFPDGLTRIGVGAFDGCTSLTSINLPDTLTDWGLESLPPAMQNNLSYDSNGFIIYNGWLLDYQNKDAASLVVPEGIVGVGAGALAGMYNLETVNLPQSLKYIAEGAFREDTYLDNLVIPDGVEIIGESAFEDCSFLQTMTLGKGVKSVGARAFAGCTQLSGAVFADGLLDVGTLAFNGCWRMQSVSLPLSTTNVASSAFSGCTALTGVTTPTHDGKMSEWFAPIYSQIRDVTVPDGETKVRVSMFEGCGSLQTVQMPDSITNIAARAFYGCSLLPEVRLPESLLTVGDEAFRNCSSLTAAALPENVTRIGARAFQGCSNLSALTLPRGLESLPDYVFADCWSLDSFVVPAAVTNLGNYIVSGQTTAIYYLGDAPSYRANVYGNASGSLKSYVILGTKGWDGRPNSRDIPASWNGRDILTWSANQFDVTFDANGGLFFSVVTNTYACEETTYTGYSLPPFEPVRKGMDFDGYWTEPSGGTRVFTSTRVLLTKPHTLYAHWKKGATIKVRFNACGGTVAPTEDDYVAERPYCELPVPVREHFAFAGWWTEASGGSRVEISSEVPKAAHELFAHWTPNVYTIRFHANDGTDATVDQSFTYGQAVTLRANTFSSEGNAFAGWALSEDGPAVYEDGKILTEVSAIQDNVINLYAVWVSTHYAVRFDFHGGVGRMENQTFVKDEEATLNACTFTRTGYTFVGWAVSTMGGVVYGDGENVVNVYELTGADVVLYAVWKSIAAEMCEELFDGVGVVSANEAWNTVVVITNDVSGTVEIPDNVGAVTIDLNGHDMVGGGGALGESALPGEPAMRIVKGTGDGETTSIAIGDTSEGGKGRIVGGGESAGIEIDKDVLPSVRINVDGGVVVLNGDGSEQDCRSLGKGLLPWPVDGMYNPLVANVYDGYVLGEDGSLAGIIQVKAAKQAVKTVTDKKTGAKTATTNVVVTATMTDAAGKKWSYAKGVGTVDGVVTGLVCTTKGVSVRSFGVTLGANGMEGEWGDSAVEGARNGMGAKGDAMMAALDAHYKKSWSVAFTNEQGATRLQLVVGAKGSTTISGTTADGFKVSATVQGIMGEDAFLVPYLATLKNGKLSRKVNLLLSFGKDGTVVARSSDLGGLKAAGPTTDEIEVLPYVKSEVSKGGEAYAGAVVLNDLAYPAKFTAKGLPAGLKIAAATGAITGTPTKPGHYTATITVTSGVNGKKKVETTVEFTIDNYTDDLIQVADSYGDYCVGVIVNEPIDAAIGCTVSGLPAGLKFAAKKTKDKTFGTVAAGTVYGVPTKAGEYTVYFKKSVKKNGKSVNHQASATFRVEALPKWATGTFVGSAECKMESAESGEMYGSATMTVGAAGKISGKIALGGTNWTFSAEAFSRVEHVERAEGGVETNFVVEAAAKAGKVSRAVALEVCGHAGDGGFVETALPNGVASGGFADGSVSLVAWRSVWKDSGMAQLLDFWKGAYDYLTDEGEPLTLTLDANGGVKAAGTLANGRKLSFSTTLLCTGEGTYWAVLYAPPATETVKQGKKKVKVSYPAFYEEVEFRNCPGTPVAGERRAWRRQGVLATVGEDSTGSGAIKYSPAYGQAAEGAAVTVTATPAKNSVFAYWTLDGEIVGYSASYKVVMGDGDFTGLEAVFRAKSDFKERPPAPFVVDDGDGDPFADLRVGVAFRARIDVDPEWHPVKFAAKNLPAGLKLNATTGVVSGVPTKAGAKTISFTATSGANAKLASPALKVSVNVAKRGG